MSEMGFSFADAGKKVNNGVKSIVQSISSVIAKACPRTTFALITTPMQVTFPVFIPIFELFPMRLVTRDAVCG